MCGPTELLNRGGRCGITGNGCGKGGFNTVEDCIGLEMFNMGDAIAGIDDFVNGSMNSSLLDAAWSCNKAVMPRAGGAL